MMEENGYYDPMQPSMADGQNQSAVYSIDNCNSLHASISLSTFTLDDLSNHVNLLISDDAAPLPALDHLAHPSIFDLEQELQSHMPQDAAPPMQHGIAADAVGDHLHGYGPTITYGVAQGELFGNMIQLPCGGAPANSISFGVYAADPPTYDSEQQMGFLPSPPPLPGASQSHLLKDLFSSLPQSYGVFCGAEERDAMAGGNVFQEMSLGYRRNEGKANFATERQRREQLNEKYKALRLLIPNPTKVQFSLFLVHNQITSRISRFLERQGLHRRRRDRVHQGTAEDSG